MKQRVQKLISQAGICSRRKAEDLILAGKVRVNGTIISLGDSADPDTDKITVNGKSLSFEQKITVALNKPKGVLSTTLDDRGRRTVMDLIDKKKISQKLFLVGRLDQDSHGLVVLTNEGTLANKVMHPSYEVRKTYAVTLNKPLISDDAWRLRQGIVVEGRTVTCTVLTIKDKEVILCIHEGRKHIVKILFLRLGYQVTDLCRTQIGQLCLGNLAVGKYRTLTPAEIKLMTINPR